jgi:tRNA (Thr-GGU) A37 N-methylase
MESDTCLTVEPIGYVYCTKQLKFDAPHQPDASSAEVNTVVLTPGKQFEIALEDLAGFDRIWLVWWFEGTGETARGFRNKVSPSTKPDWVDVCFVDFGRRVNPNGWTFGLDGRHSDIRHQALSCDGRCFS